MRTLNQRAVKNAANFGDIEKKLARLKLSKDELQDFTNLDYTCPLSGDTIYGNFLSCFCFCSLFCRDDEWIKIGCYDVCTESNKA